MRQRLAQEGGFTLPEMLVTMTMMILVLFALYSIFDMSIRVFSFGNDKVEAVENARLGLEKMEREIRMAHPVDKANNLDHVFFTANGAGNLTPPTDAPPQEMPAEGQITFGNDLDGDHRVSCPNSQSECEYITYRLDPTNYSTLLRNNTVNGSNASTGGDPVVEFVDGASGLKFFYCNSATDCPPGSPLTHEADINMVRVQLKIKVDEGTQTLSTDIALRNRVD